MPGALKGVRVVDFGHYIAGPLAATMLSDQGADVIHVDPPGGPRWKVDADAFLNRGKRRISLDLKAEDDLAIARRLIDRADVLIENFRPDVMDRLGLGADAHSFDGRLRWQNVEDAAEYASRVARGESARTAPLEARLMEERFFVGLRLSVGVRPDAAEWVRWKTPIDRFVSQGLLERDGGALRLTDRGIIFSNEVFEEFVSA